MNPEEELHELMESLYRRSGEATGYWPSYFLRDVRANGGLAVAKKLLGPGLVSSGFDRLIDVQRADLSVEAIVLDERFRGLFTAEELAEARTRLNSVPESAFPDFVARQDHPDEVAEDPSYAEGAVRKVPVNAYERSSKARAACIREHGTRCAVCGFDFEATYGAIGAGFIHVHHKRPLAQLNESYRVNPKRDLVPVCPNCHAMIHRRDPPFDIEQLRSELRRVADSD